MKQSNAAPTFDPFFPSGHFAKLPAEAFSSLAVSGPQALSHAEFRLLAALCRFRGVSRLVYPTRALLERLTGMTPNNVSRITRALQEKGWLKIHYVEGNSRRKVANYELCVPAKYVGAKPTTVKAEVAVPTEERASVRAANCPYDDFAELPDANDLGWGELVELLDADANS